MYVQRLQLTLFVDYNYLGIASNISDTFKCPAEQNSFSLKIYNEIHLNYLLKDLLKMPPF